MRFEIDDAGTGDLLGDAIIGFYIEEKDVFIAKHIPLEYFQNENAKLKYPEKFTAELIINTLNELGFNPKNDTIFICTGNIFVDAKKLLKDKGYKYTETKIEGVLQQKVEQAYLDYLKTLGVNVNITIESGKDRYFQLFNWLVEDYPNRRKYVKTGFNMWQKKWEQIALERYQKKGVAKPNYKYRKRSY